MNVVKSDHPYDREHGWTIDTNADLACVLRLPGTINHTLKDHPARVRVIQLKRRTDATPDLNDFLVEDAADMAAVQSNTNMR